MATLTNTDNPIKPLPLEGVKAIHNTAMRILKEIGIEFLNLEAVNILRQAGCSVSNETSQGALIKMDRTLVMGKIALAPAKFSITPRNIDRKITVGGKHIVFGSVASPPNCSNLDRGRRPGNIQSHQDLVKLSQYFNCIYFIGGYPVEPVDSHACMHPFVT